MNEQQTAIDAFKRKEKKRNEKRETTTDGCDCDE
jgi:hypothetical protein